MKKNSDLKKELQRLKLKKAMEYKFVPKEWGEFCDKDSEANRSQIFAILREKLFLKSTYWNNNTLSEVLSITPQRCSLYATGSDRQASWWSIMRLCQMLNYRIVLTPKEVRIEEDDT